VYNLGEMQTPRAVEPLIRCLQSSDEIVRVGALKALAKIGDPRAVPAVYEVATGRDAFGVRVDAVSTLGTLRDRRAVPLIVAMLAEEDCPHPGWYQKWAAKRLIEMKATEAIPNLVEARRHARMFGRWHLSRAVEALKEIERNPAA
jgi:HEAT repeat protein